MGDTQLGIRTTKENKEFFNSLVGKNQHEKFEILKRLYNENIAKEENEFNINRYVADIESTFNNLINIIKGLESSANEYKEMIYNEYVVKIGENLAKIEENLKKNDKNEEKNEILIKENERLTEQIKINSMIYDGYVESLQKEIAELHDKNFNLIKELDEYKKENNELIKNNKKLLMENTNLLIKNDNLEGKIKQKSSSRTKTKKFFK